VLVANLASGENRRDNARTFHWIPYIELFDARLIDGQRNLSR
jgi:hypothetical protein